VTAVDVRDLARVVAALMEPGRGPRRFLSAGETVSLVDLTRLVAEVTGRRLRARALPGAPLLAMGHVADLLQRALSVRLPASFEAIYLALQDPRCDNSRTWSELGVTPRPLRETVRDTILWLHREGHLSARDVGTLADAAA
jgi:nucleoside-diphosphate-sugar epimerase